MRTSMCRSLDWQPGAGWVAASVLPSPKRMGKPEVTQVWPVRPETVARPTIAYRTALDPARSDRP
jgi:hypothetical protein